MLDRASWFAAVVVAMTAAAPALFADQTVAPDNPLIELGGLCFARPTPGLLYLDRFSQAVMANPGDVFNPDDANTPACVTLRFRTNSSWVRANFTEIPGLNRGDDFSIFQNGAPAGRLVGLNLMLNSVNPGQPVTFKIVCPSVSAVAFQGLQIEDTAALFPVAPLNRYRYAAFGDSITHGIGQDAWSDLSYPWLLAETRNWQVFNFGVAGSFATSAFGAMVDDFPFDIATVLWGQNDWNWQNDLPLFTSRCEQFVTDFRAHHPTTALYLITLIASTRTTPSPNNGYTRENYRQAVRDLVAARVTGGDSHIFVLEGLSLTSLTDLSDGVHFSTSGASNFAAALDQAIPFHNSPEERCDFDRDGDVDLSDFAHFQLCLSGPGVPQYAEECHDARLDDGDNDVDGNDFMLFQPCLTGAGLAPLCL